MPNIRTLTPTESQSVIDWAAAEGWNPGMADLDAFLAQDSGLFLGLEEDGVLQSVIAATRYGADFGFIGCYIARPEARGRGFGIAIWRAGMAQLAGRLVGLDGVVAQQDNYRKSGFALAWNNIRFGGTPTRRDAPANGVVDAGSVPFAAVAAFDRTVFPGPRDAFLRTWIATPGHIALAAVADGEVTGFGVIRPSREGHKIGPLTAQTPKVAEALLAALLARIPPGPVFWDVPQPHADAMRLAEAVGLVPGFETARMYKGPLPDLRMDRMFGIASLELG
ncbi:GNAT family N-acetyltransferase [Humitalea sp. 24SJ18S-53]|uniref:GNAT family N-acetyltransferase n=1 Tax=Humitalea sp. 24SJ18S-53 TaxID=3422307 RepID=UPI003D664D44